MEDLKDDEFEDGILDLEDDYILEGDWENYQDDYEDDYEDDYKEDSLKRSEYYNEWYNSDDRRAGMTFEDYKKYYDLEDEGDY